MKKKTNILVVDDDSDILNQISTVLTDNQRYRAGLLCLQ